MRLSKHRVAGADQVDKGARTIFASLASWKRLRYKLGKSNNLDDISLSWIQRFSPIYTGKPEQFPSYALPTFWIQKMLSAGKSQVVHYWNRLVIGLPISKSRHLWQEVMLWALQHQVDKAMMFLDITLSDSTAAASRHAVEDSLKHIVSIFLQGQTVNSEIKNDIYRLLCLFAETSMLQDSFTHSISQKIVYLVMRHSDNHQTRVLYEALLGARLDIHPHTLTHFMDRFTLMGRPDLSMHVLRKITSSGANVSYETVQFSCMKLLRTRFHEIEWYKVQSQLLTEMLELGLRPGIPMLNAMILNAVEAGDYQTALAMFETARIHGIRRDTITYSILLKGAVQNLDEVLVERIMHMAEEDGALPRNNELVYSLVVTLLQIARLKDTNTLTSANRYKEILRIYSRYCIVVPLQELGIYFSTGKTSDKARTLSDPSPKLLSIMIVSFIRLIGRSDLVQALYARYQTLLEQNHGLVAPTAITDHLANAFLFSLGRHRATFKTCPAILKNMLKPSASTNVKVARPTVRTWSIAARSYFFHGQRAAGEKVIQMMRARGILPNLVTWNTIISGYASLQDASGVVNAMKGMEAAGFESSSSTLKALARMKDRNQLLDALRRVAANDVEKMYQAPHSNDPMQTAIEAPSAEGDGSIQTHAMTGDGQGTKSSGRMAFTQQGMYYPAPSNFVDASTRLDRFRQSLNEHRAAYWRENDADHGFLDHLQGWFETFNFRQQSTRHYTKP